jgi:CheY-like chemotaxis protein
MKGASVLIVEDDGLIAMHLSETLEKAGYQVMSPENSGENAISRIGKGLNPDVILMDIGLSGKIDGIQTTREIRQICDIPVIFLTAYSNEARINEAKKISPYGYILKPCMEHDLVGAIEKALHR